MRIVGSPDLPRNIWWERKDSIVFVDKLACKWHHQVLQSINICNEEYGDYKNLDSLTQQGNGQKTYSYSKPDLNDQIIFDSRCPV